MKALVLAAGMGKRLHSNINKCMVNINGMSLWERLVLAFKMADITNVIVVTGYHANELEDYILQHSPEINVCFVRNSDYEKTNNIWSLYLTYPYIDEDIILLESDLIFEENIIKDLCECPFPNVAVLSKMQSWMDGTTVCLKDKYIEEIVPKNEMMNHDFSTLYKTVNIYKLSMNFLKSKYFPALSKYISEHGKDEYYEMVLKKMVVEETELLIGLELTSRWYEIDTIEDLKRAESLFVGGELS